MFGSEKKEKIDNLTQELIYLRQNLIELQQNLLHFVTAAKRLEKKKKRQQWRFHHK